jgi:glycosyltransferase involved in cell wall biosynthesis
MNIIFVIFQTGSQANGGVESITQVIENSRHLRPHIVTQIATPINQRWEQAAATVSVWGLPYVMGMALLQGNGWNWLQRFYSLLQTNVRMFWRVVRSRTHVVHCNDPAAFWHTALGAKLAGAAVVFNIRDTKAADEVYGWKWSVAGWLSDRLLVLSAEMRQSLTAALPLTRSYPHKLQAIYSIVDTATLTLLPPDERQSLRQQLGIAPETLAIAYIATVNPKKAQLALIESGLPQLRERLPQAHLYLVGDCAPENDYANQCRATVNRLGLNDAATFVGYTPQVADWYRAVDLVIVASRKEGLARCMIESLACGTPVVSFAVCSAAEILTGFDCGRVVPEGDYAALTTAIADLAAHPTRRQQLGNNGVRMAQKLFQPSAIAQQYEDLYRSLSATRRFFPQFTFTAPPPKGQTEQSG